MALILRERVLAVPGWARFPTVDDLETRVRGLHRSLEGRSRLDVIGHSRAGSPLTMLSVGGGARHALVLGMPHPNEPTGALACLWLAELLGKDADLVDELGFAWHFVACADPDGARLNEAWFGGPFTPYSYASQLYRPPVGEQFEWTFHDAALAEPGLASTPESRAVMSVIDSLRPELVLSMHNAEEGGFYTYVSDVSPDLRREMVVISEAMEIPLELGDPDVPGARLGPGLFHSPPVTVGGPGICSTDYAGLRGAFSLTVEPPLWVDSRAGDESVAPRLPDGVFEATRARTRALHADWVSALEKELQLGDSVRGRAVLSDTSFIESEWPPHGSRTIAEVASWERAIDLERTRAAGHVIALLRSRGALTPLLEGVLADAAAALADWTSREAQYRFVGLDRAVACHVGVALAAAAAL